jgi:hypothetical protein
MPPKKKGMSGCMIALLVVVGLCVVGGLVIGLIVWRVATSEEGKKIVNAVSSGAQMAVEAQNAPGTAELRALGCAQAMVMDAAKVQELAAQFGDAGPKANGLIVTCNVSRAGKAPTCDDVATTYVKAVGGRASGRFEVTVDANGDKKAGCAVVYDPEGRRAATK